MSFRIIRLCVLVLALAWAVAMTAARAAGPDAHLTPFHNRQIRPVPGYTLACQHVTDMVNGARIARADVTVVLPAKDGSRIRYLQNDRDKHLFEVDIRFDAGGAVAGTPSVLRDGTPDATPAAARIADSLRKAAGAAIYTGAPLSSGDTFIVPVTRDEMQAAIDRLWPRPMTVEKYVEVGRVAGLDHSARFGELVIVERASQGVFNDHGTRIEFAARTRQGIATASGLGVTSTVDMTFSGPLGTVGGHQTTDCRYAARPADPQPQEKPTTTASAR